jgi:hypothetical protein
MSETEQLFKILFNEMKEIKTNMATKQDLKSMATKQDLESMATKQDLESMATKQDLESMATKQDLKSMATKQDLKSMATKQDLESMATKIDSMSVKLDKLSETIASNHIENINSDNLLLNEIRSLREGVIFVNRKVADAELEIHSLKQNKQ